MKIFAERVKTLRTEKSLTQIEFARKMGVSNGTVGGWETAKILPSVPVLLKLAEFFGCTTDYLLGRSEY